MGVRLWANEHPKSASAIGGAFILVCLGAIVVDLLASRRTYPTRLPDFYFTSDDGKSFFASSSANYPPFDYRGQPAVRAHVFESNGRRFVGYLDRFNATTIAKLKSGHPLTAEMVRFGRELKRPGSSSWIKSGDLASVSKLQNVKSPDGTSDIPDAVEP